ncbi:MAG: class I SAM-dependent methyltransferase, partial [Lacunisphaera sp.]
LWKSELKLIEQYFPDKSATLLEAGCGAGRVAVGLWHQGYRNITAFDFAAELIDQAENLAQEQGIAGISFLQADATMVGTVAPNGPAKKPKAATRARALEGKRPYLPQLSRPTKIPARTGGSPLAKNSFDGALFMFNGLMQIPGRENRRAALGGLHALCRPGAHFIFTTHDREDPKDVKEWAKEAARWAVGEQDSRLLEFGDRYFSDDTGNTFMHLPDRKEVLEEMKATGWSHVYDSTRNELASETPKVRNFSDNCRFWVALRDK